MSNKIYVGNLPYSVTDSTLECNFAEFGRVSSAKVMMDRETGRSKGFGFVEMASAEVAQAAIKALDGMSVDGRSITVNLARLVKKAVARAATAQTASRHASGRTLAMAMAATAVVVTDASYVPERPALPVFFRSAEVRFPAARFVSL